ncbi:hypothetical protein [Desertibaculum subflavum]|uniref:hypothetical protein n=1 Tax=Desertibaculum subflavum TaxID=2268458 RepID=UPI000E67511E
MKYLDTQIRTIVETTGPLPDTDCEHWRYDDDAKEVVVRVPRIVALKERLETAALHYEFHAKTSDRPSPSELVGRLDDIRAAADRLLVALRANAPEEDRLTSEARYALQGQAIFEAQARGGFDDVRPLPFGMRGGPNEYINWGGPELVRKSVEGVRRLSRWSQKASARAARRKGTVENVGPADKALNEWIASLRGIYLDIYQAVPTPSGRFCKFVVAAAELLGLTIDPEAMRARLRRQEPKRSNRRKNKSGSAITKATSD